MIWMGVQLFFGFVLGALLLWACVAGISALVRSLKGLEVGFREGFEEGVQQSLQKRFPSTSGSSGSYAGPTGPPELWGQHILPRGMAPPTAALLDYKAGKITAEEYRATLIKRFPTATPAQIDYLIEQGKNFVDRMPNL
jgi:hypothetical protein